MTSVNIREFSHHLSKYLNQVKKGEKVVLMERNVPIADIIPHNVHISRPGWKRSIKKLALVGESLTDTVIRNRRQESR